MTRQRSASTRNASARTSSVLLCGVGLALCGGFVQMNGDVGRGVNDGQGNMVGGDHGCVHV